MVGAFEARLAETETHRRAVLAGGDQRLEIRDQGVAVHAGPAQVWWGVMISAIWCAGALSTS